MNKVISIKPEGDLNTPLRSLAQALHIQGFFSLSDAYRMLTLIRGNNEPIHIRFTQNEWLVVKALIRAFPAHALREDLLSEILGVPLEKGRLGGEHLRSDLRPVRSAIHKSRAKLHVVGLTINSIRDQGYQLDVAWGAQII